MLVEARMMHTLALSNMDDVHSRLGPWAAGSARQVVCEGDIEDAPLQECTQAWASILMGLAFPAHATASLAREVANAVCPRGPIATANVAAHGSANATNRSESGMRVARLIRLDKEHLEGALSGLAARLPCKLSSRYTPIRAPATTNALQP